MNGQQNPVSWAAAAAKKKPKPRAVKRKQSTTDPQVRMRIDAPAANVQKAKGAPVEPQEPNTEFDENNY